MDVKMVWQNSGGMAPDQDSRHIISIPFVLDSKSQNMDVKMVWQNSGGMAPDQDI